MPHKRPSAQIGGCNRPNFPHSQSAGFALRIWGMLRFSLMGIPVGIDWWFWLVSVMLGDGLSARSPEDWARVAVWVAVVFVSIMVHELGHALAGRRYGASPAIALHGFGGTTFLPGGQFTRSQSIIVSAAGPAAGLLLGLLVLGMADVAQGMPRLARLAISYGIYVNLFWTFVNLLPIQPLDGGQILREVLGPRRVGITSAIGFVLAVLLGIWCFAKGLLFSALMLGLLAFYNFRQEPVQGGVVKE